MALPDELAADLAELETEIPATFTWNGAAYPCTRGSVRRSKALGSGGFSLDADLILYVRTAHFADVASRPQLKQKLTFEDRDFRLEEITVPAGSPFLKLTCADAARAL